MRIALLSFGRDDADAISASLTSIGHVCVQCAGTRDLQEPREGFALAVLNLQSSTGVETLRSIRDQRAELPVLLVASRDEERVGVLIDALEAGANDYLVKPLRRGELATRVQVLLKRSYPQQADEQIRFGRFGFEPHMHRITRDDDTISVTQKEFELALLFFRHLDRPLSRTYIKEAIWSGEMDVPSRTLDTHVSRVRSKLGLRPENGFRLAPVYSYGYRLQQLST